MVRSADKLSWFLQHSRKVLMDKLFMGRKLSLTTKAQHHLLQPKVIHNKQTHITINNHQNKIINKPHLNRVRFFIRLHIFKKISDGCKCGKCLMLSFLLFTTIFALYSNIHVQELLLQIWVMFICNMFFHGYKL